MGTVEYATPRRHRIGDTVTIVLFGPLALGAFFFSTSIPVVIAFLLLGARVTLEGVVAVAGPLGGILLAAMAVKLRPWLVWGMRLEADHLVLLGLGGAARVPWDDVELVRAGAIDAVRRAPGTVPESSLVTFLVKTRAREFRLNLRRADARLAVPDLLARARRACGIDLDGRDHLPADDSARSAGRRLLARLWLAWGAAFVLLGSAALGTGAYAAFGSARAGARIGAVLSYGLGSLLGGLGMLARGRAHRRAEAEGKRTAGGPPPR